MPVIVLIKREDREIPALVERLKTGDEFCFVINQKKITSWRKAAMNGRDNLEIYRHEIEAHGGDVSVAPMRVATPNYHRDYRSKKKTKLKVVQR